MAKILEICFAIIALQLIIFAEAKWTKINHFPICFEGRGNKPGNLMYTGKEIIVGALRLDWESGSIRCVSDKAYDSRWGCHHHSSYRSHPFNVVVTDGKNQIIFPLKEYIKTSGLWYIQPAHDDKESKSLVFSDFSSPLVLQKMMQLRIWYGEDLRNSAETDNQGRVCVNVLAYVLNNPSSDIGGGGAGGAGGSHDSAAVKLVASLKSSFSQLLKS